MRPHGYVDAKIPKPAWQERAWRGTIQEDVTDMAQRVHVIIPAFDETRVWGPYRWQARDSASHPARGDDCLVVFDEMREGWVIAWWPFS